MNCYIKQLNCSIEHYFTAYSRHVSFCDESDGICDAHFVRVDATINVWIDWDNFTTVNIQPTPA